MSTSAVHDLKLLVRSFHTLVAVETVEEKRLEEVLYQVANDTGLTFFTWDLNSGLCKHPSDRSVFANTVEATSNSDPRA